MEVNSIKQPPLALQKLQYETNASIKIQTIMSLNH